MSRSMLRARTVFEWILLVVSAAAILTIVGALVYFGAAQDESPPALRATVTGSGPVLRLDVENRGGTTAEEVVLEVRRGTDTQEVEFRTVAKGDSEQATVFLEGGGTPTVRVLSYKEP